MLGPLQPQPNNQAEAGGYHCHHYGARPLSRCYCGELVSRLDYYAAKETRDAIRYECGSRWVLQRDAAGQVRSMGWVW